MDVLILVIAMIAVGLLMGWIAGFIWKNNRPIGARGDYLAAVITTIVVGLIDWYIIPAMGVSENLRNIGVVFEPALGALLVLWLVRVAKK